MDFSLFAAATATVASITAPGPNGPLAGTLVDAGKNAPVVLIIAGSGPTDRDGNNPHGVTAAPYRLLADGLAAKGVSTVRIDKRGMFGSKGAVADPNAVTLSDYSADMHNWVDSIRSKTGAKCVWVLGHSEGGLVALEAARKPANICGLILVAAPGRKFGDILREQLEANPANAPVLDDAMKAIDSLESGIRVDVSALHPALQRLFAPQVQGYLIDLMATDPATLAANVKLPMLIVQGGKDLQVGAADAKALSTANPAARVVNLPRMNHVLRDVDGDDREANIATYADPSVPLDPKLIDSIVGFIAAR